MRWPVKPPHRPPMRVDVSHKLCLFRLSTTGQSDLKIGDANRGMAAKGRKKCPFSQGCGHPIGWPLKPCFGTLRLRRCGGCCSRPLVRLVAWRLSSFDLSVAAMASIVSVAVVRGPRMGAFLLSGPTSRLSAHSGPREARSAANVAIGNTYCNGMRRLHLLHDKVGVRLHYATNPSDLLS